jgi:hypothetical protein
VNGDLPFGVPSRVPGGAWVQRVPEPAARRDDEFKLQQAICRYLDVALPHDATYFSVPNGGLRHKKAAIKLIATGLTAGVPDLLVIWCGRALFIELKTATGRVSMAQRAMHKRLVHCGAEVMLCRSLPEVEAALREATVPLRASVMA